MDRKRGSLYKALLALALGHFLAMAAILFPFTVLLFLAEWRRPIQIGAAGLVIGLGTYLLINRGHPRFRARVAPSRLALWSFLAATAHGAGLMLVPVYLGLFRAAETDAGHTAAWDLIGGNAEMATMVALVHTLAMTLSGGVLAIAVYMWLGLRFLSRSWFNLDIIWAVSLILVGAISLLTA